MGLAGATAMAAAEMAAEMKLEARVAEKRREAAMVAEAKAVVRVRTGAERSRGQSRVLGVNDFVHSMPRWSK